MKIYTSKHYDIFKNLSISEAFLFNADVSKEDILFISQNKKSIVIGRNQNIYKIINHDFIEKKGINITRRLSGGGTIYQDSGTISFSFITQNSNRLLKDVLKPIIAFLHSINLDAKVKNKKNIYVGNHKIAVISQYHYDEKILYQGTLLFNSDLDMLANSLTHENHINETRLTKSKDSNVCNIKQLLNSNWTTKTFTIQLINFFQKRLDKFIEEIPKEIQNAANKIWIKTSSWEWVYGPCPKFNNDYQNNFNDKGNVEIKYNHENGKIKKIKIFGDFHSFKDTSEVENALVNVSLKRSSLLKALSPFKSSLYFGRIPKKEIVNTIISDNFEANNSKN